MNEWLVQAIAWARTDDFEFPYLAEVGGKTLVVRVNEWPDYPSIYTLFVDDAEVGDFDDWPEAWVRPADEGDEE